MDDSAPRERSQAVVLHRAVFVSLTESAARAAEMKELAQRVQAEFLNYQARAKRDREEAARYRARDLAAELLPALDSLGESERALRGSARPDEVLDGLKIIHKEFLRILAKHGVTPIEAVGKPFDPRFHEVVGTAAKEGAEPGTVVEEVRGGWMMHERVLRAAAVRIAP
jgi:molecular chaperone GrpE